MLVGTAAGVVVGVLLHVVGPIADRRLRGFGSSFLSRWQECELMAALIGGAFGGASHSLLDSMMHSDVQQRVSLRQFVGKPLLAYNYAQW